VVTAVGLGVASCVIQATMNWAQKSVTPARATIIYTGEPVWAGIIGRVAGDRLPGLALVGAGLIVASVLVSELKPHSNPRPRREQATHAGSEPAAGSPETTPGTPPPLRQ
jgi:drug/metabolite transporter (DMT)-like permease